MSFAAHRSRLAALTRDLGLRWAETRETWRDARAEEFERTYLAELRSQVDRTVGTLEQLDVLLGKAREDCE